MGTQATRILSTKTVIPDCTIMIPANKIQPLSHSAKSPYKTLKGHASVVKSGSASKGSSFRYQSTPCANLPDTAQFEFISSFWEDKKPVHHMLEDAYRQNRMATASAVRHLHSLRIRAPIFGLVWASGSVKAHVDWCKSEEGATPVGVRIHQCTMYDTESPLLFVWKTRSSFRPHIRETMGLQLTKTTKAVIYSMNGNSTAPAISCRYIFSSEISTVGQWDGFTI